MQHTLHLPTIEGSTKHRTRSLCSQSKLLQVIDQKLHIRQNVAPLLLSRDKCQNTEERHKDKLFLKDGSEGYGSSAVHTYLGVQLAEEGTIDYKVTYRICKAEAAQMISIHFSATRVCLWL